MLECWLIDSYMNSENNREANSYIISEVGRQMEEFCDIEVLEIKKTLN